jgi:hypothetical protein
MTKQKKQEMVKFIEETLTTTQKLWDDRDVSHAHIIGYLEGTLKQIKREIKKSEQLNK